MADKGFGVTAEAFKEAAGHLNDNNFTDNIAIVQGEMPIFYLYRHSPGSTIPSLKPDFTPAIKVIIILHHHMPLFSKGTSM